MVLFLSCGAGNCKKILYRCLCRCSFIDAGTNERFSALWLLLPVKPIFTTGLKMWMQWSKRTKPYLQISSPARGSFKVRCGEEGPCSGLHTASTWLCQEQTLQVLGTSAPAQSIEGCCFSEPNFQGRRQKRKAVDFFKLDSSAERKCRIIGKTCNKLINFTHRFWPENYWLMQH